MKPQTEETLADPMLINRYDYDGIFGTALNRFVVQVGGGCAGSGVGWVGGWVDIPQLLCGAGG